MESLFSEMKAELADHLFKAVKEAGYEATEQSVTVDESKAFGDMASSIAMKVAEQKKLNPKEGAEKISAKIKLPEYVTTVATENGFINFHFGRTQFANLFFSHEVLEKTLQPV